MRTKSSRLIRNAAVFAAALTAISACASNPAADEKIAVAKASVQRAEGSGAPELAPVEMASARNKLTGAEQANTQGHLVPAVRLADQANADAELAEATAKEKQSHQAAMEFDASMLALRQESMRSSQPTQ